MLSDLIIFKISGTATTVRSINRSPDKFGNTSITTRTIVSRTGAASRAAGITAAGRGTSGSAAAFVATVYRPVGAAVAVTGTVNPAPVGRTGITTGFTVGISCHAIHRARCSSGSTAAFTGFVRSRTLAGRIFSAAGLTHAALRIGTGHKITAANAFVIIAAVVRTFLVGRLYRRTLRRLPVTFFLAGFIIVAFA